MRMSEFTICCILGLALASDCFAGVIRPSSTSQSTARSEPVTFDLPLQSNVFFPGGAGTPWMAPRSAWVSRDGRYVAFFVREAPSDENTSRTLVIKDVDKDVEVFTKVILSEEDSRRQGGAFQVDLARVQAWEVMAQLDGYGFLPMASMNVAAQDKVIESFSCYEEQIHIKYSLSLDELKVTYEEPRLQIWRRGKKVLDQQVPDWTSHRESCQRASPSWMNRVFVDRVRGVVLVELEFCGADHCLEPASAFHVLRISTDTPRAQTSLASQKERARPPPSLHYERTDEMSKTTYYAKGFPAVSKDGSLVALAETFSDVRPGDSEPLPFRVTVRRPGSDEIVWSFPVVEAKELAAARHGQARDELDKKMRERIRQVNDHLGQTEWVPLVEQPVTPRVTDFCQQAPAQRVQWADRRLLFHQGHLRLEGDQISSREWSMPDLSPSPDAEALPDAGGSTDGGLSASSACAATSRRYIDSAYAEGSTGLVLLRFASCQDGPDSCPENFGGYHAFKWP